MNRCVPLAVLAAFSLAFALPAIQAAPDAPAAVVPSLDEKCAPPCGYILPTIGIDAAIKKEQLRTSQLADLPQQLEVTVTYSWDMEQDGTGIPGNADPMKVTVIINKKPTWLKATLTERPDEPCEFMIVPTTSQYDVCTLDLTLEIDPQYLPVDEEAFDKEKRLMLFGTSEESGMYKKSYGVEDIRWSFDEVPTVEGMPEIATTSEESPSPVLAPAGIMVALALLVGLRRRD